MRTLSLTLALFVAGSAAGLAQQAFDPVKRKQALQHYQRGEELMQRETFEDAATEFKKAIEIDPSLILAHYSLGQCYMALQRYVEAAAAYRDCRDAFMRLQSLDQRDRGALRRANDDEVRGLRQTINEIRAGHIKSASPERDIVQAETRIQVLERSNQSTDPSTPVPAELELALGSAYYHQGKLQDAEREYLEALKADSKFGPAHNNLAVIYMLTGRLTEAQDAVRKAEKAGTPVSSKFKDDLKRQQAAAKP